MGILWWFFNGCKQSFAYRRQRQKVILIFNYGHARTREKNGGGQSLRAIAWQSVYLVA